MIEVSGLRHRYRPHGEDVIAGLDHVFETGSATVVIGPSGSGKSTLLYLLGLLLTPTAGSVGVENVDTATLSDAARSTLRAAHIGFVFQDSALDATRTVLDNVIEGGLYAGLSRRASARRATELLSLLGVELRATHRPGEVSGGQAQRIGLCRALVKDPRVILADEPTGNLDQTSASVVLDALAGAAAGGSTVVVSSHDPAVAAWADDVLEI